mmetsp:Transcript_16794/g.50936  ORF Transcript_16794/g.50936 Transcript_16794/m.50936 type:complete len:703 (+) Transcript_16794:1005-3113(+)
MRREELRSKLLLGQVELPRRILRRRRRRRRRSSSVTVFAAEAGPHARIRVYDQSTWLSTGKALGQVAFSLRSLLGASSASLAARPGAPPRWSEPEWLSLVSLDGRTTASSRKKKRQVLVSVALLAPQGKPLSVACCSLNCGNAAIEPLDALVPPSANLVDFLPTDFLQKRRFDEHAAADVVVLGLQEATTSRMGAGPRADRSRTAAGDDGGVASDEDSSGHGGGASGGEKSNKSQKNDLKRTLAGLLPKHEIVCAASRGQMRLFVFVRSPLAAGVHEKRVAYENTGLAHLYANKGGIAFACSVAGASQASLVFFSAHLAAHEGEAYRLRRNSDVREIVSGCRSGLVRGSASGVARSPVAPALDVDAQIDYSFFIGDLNYRVGDDLISYGTRDDSLCATSTGQGFVERSSSSFSQTPHPPCLPDLARDELSVEMANERVFCGAWTAPAPAFPPTFKVHRGEACCVYNTKRAPSWCDRVLYKARDVAHPTASFAARRQELLSFDSVPQVKSSDHKPVRAVWLLYPAPLRPLARLEHWRLAFVDVVLDSSTADTVDVSGEELDANTPRSSRDSAASARSQGARSRVAGFVTNVRRGFRVRDAGPRKPRLALRALTTPRECLRDPATSVAPQRGWTARWPGRCLDLNVFLEHGAHLFSAVRLLEGTSSSQALAVAARSTSPSTPPSDAPGTRSSAPRTSPSRESAA